MLISAKNSFLIFIFIFLSAVLFNPMTGLYAQPVSHSNESVNIDSSKIDLKIVTDEAEQVIAILKKRSSSQPLTEVDWQKLFLSEGYTRLKKRELSMKRSFTDEDFKSFVLSDTLLQKEQLLSETLSKWKQSDVYTMAQHALSYLPEEAKIRAKIYPVIKPRPNSFVFEVDTDPAIFLFIDPSKSKEKFENTVTHELHHIGYSTGCASSEAAVDSIKDESVKTAVIWISAFGEGLAMLAAAGSPDIHPHYCSLPEEKERWDKDVANFNDDLKKLEKFFFDILNKKLTKEEIHDQGFSFLGIQGPWYTVGWKMAAVIEKTFGRQRLLNGICNHTDLLAAYNAAVNNYNRSTGEHLIKWSPELLQKTGN